MADRQATATIDGLLKEHTIQEFKASLRGTLLHPGDDSYEEARKIWNGMIDKRPGLIVRCMGIADVINAVNFARDYDLLMAVRAGGHNVAGTAVCDGGIVIDLSLMKGICVDPVTRTAWAQPGLLWGEFDHETHAFGLATTGGIVTHTGIAGLTLGGGIGWLMRKHGLTCDNLLSADVVTADGRFLRASEDEHANLFGGLRGGGGNFGLVTSFEYRLHSVGPLVLAGVLLHPAERAQAVLRFYRDYIATVPDELTTIVNLRQAPYEDRSAHHVLNINAVWSDALESDQHIQWARDFWEATHPISNGGIYVNFLGNEGEERVRAAYGPTKYARLVALKNQYDPTNLFCLNQNIKPTV